MTILYCGMVLEQGKDENRLICNIMSVFQSHRCDKSSEMKTLQVQYGLKSSYQQASKETYRLQGRVHSKLEFEVNCPWHVIQTLSLQNWLMRYEGQNI